MRILIIVRVALVSVCLLAQCRDDARVFRLRHADESGLDFSNTIVESDTFNALSFEYIYNGGGVGVADFNNDGLTDIFLSGNRTSCRLYLNSGNLSFVDVTTQAGVATDVWCTGVSMVDINGDSRMDIYVSTIHTDKNKKVPNIFFINEGVDDRGVPRFENRAVEMGLADSSYSTQAVFFDYDIDGDLDMYLLTNSLESYPRNSYIGQRNDGTGKSVDRLYRHDVSSDNTRQFTNVSGAAGILAEGWGLGIVVNDFNNDGWPDVYCANDFLSSDHLYMNQQNGTFRDEIGSYMNHQEFNGMGVDMADLNNDGLNDLVALDMMPDDNRRQKAMFSGLGYDRFMKSIQMKYQPQYIRNVLQRNNGNATFSDIGYMSGIYATDWSWSALLADFDNDGLRDIFISNGYPKDITDLDFVTYNQNVTQFGTDELKRKNAAKAIQQLGGVFKPNFLFHNEGNFEFTNVSNAWGLSDPGYSNGAAYADLDNDGDLDLVINNLNGPSHIYENRTNQKDKVAQNFLQILLQGPRGNPQGIGTKVTVFAGGHRYDSEQQLQRGYLSSVDPVMHFGLATATKVDSVVVRWPGDRMEVMRDVAINLRTHAVYDRATRVYRPPAKSRPWLVKSDGVPHAVQPEQDFADYKQGQATLPHKFSQQGPPLAVGDINGDGLEDFVIGGSSHERALIFYQKPDGSFYKADSLGAKPHEDTGLCLFDADNDLDLDLYAVSGGSEFGKTSPFYQDRLYINDGAGNFSIDKAALPAIGSSGSCVIAADVDNDGDHDLFVGGRVVPTSYPLAPRSYLLQNNGKGKFEDVTSRLSANLDSIGMVTCALFSDFDNDGWKDLIVAGEWMPITLFRNEQGSFRKVGELKAGWWSSLAEGDFDNDGDMDYIAGNLGRNSVLRASGKEPVTLYAKDFDGNGSMDVFISRFINGKEYPVHYRETMIEQVVSLRRILRSYSDFGKLQMSDIITYLGPADVVTKRIDFFESAYLENKGGVNFALHPLPASVQVSPVNSVSVCDINNDGRLDFLAVGNSFSEETLSGFYDAGIGVCALGNGDGTFKILPPLESGFCVRSDAKFIKQLQTAHGRTWIVTSNRAPLVVFREQDRAKNISSP